ncbi:unnamed protein product [Brassica rapa subsp. trilocularis]
MMKKEVDVLMMKTQSTRRRSRRWSSRVGNQVVMRMFYRLFKETKGLTLVQTMSFRFLSNNMNLDRFVIVI